jgi:hypothetical protein
MGTESRSASGADTGDTAHGRDELWAHLAADARRIVPVENGFLAPMPGAAAAARFDIAGVSIGGDAAEDALRLRFAGWGPPGAEEAVALVEPALGACVRDTLPDGACARRLEYAHDDVTAWWIGLDRGVEFGWTIERAAPGAATVALHVAVEGADWLAAAEDGAEIVDGAGASWIVDGAVAWDADGAPLRAAVDVRGDHLVISVDVRGAAWPITVDPVLSAATSALTGETTQTSLGYSVSRAGDVDADGYDDIIVGAYAYDTASVTNAGRAYVFHGSAAGIESVATTTLTGTTTNEYLGYAVANAGDVDGDGYDDVIVGAYRYDTCSITDAGRVYVHHGSASGVSVTPATTLEGTSASAFYGGTVASAGDVNADGYGDRKHEPPIPEAYHPGHPGVSRSLSPARARSGVVRAAVFAPRAGLRLPVPRRSRPPVVAARQGYGGPVAWSAPEHVAGETLQSTAVPGRNVRPRVQVVAVTGSGPRRQRVFAPAEHLRSLHSPGAPGGEGAHVDRTRPPPPGAPHPRRDHRRAHGPPAPDRPAPQQPRRGRHLRGRGRAAGGRARPRVGRDPAVAGARGARGHPRGGGQNRAPANGDLGRGIREDRRSLRRDRRLRGAPDRREPPRRAGPGGRRPPRL